MAETRAAAAAAEPTPPRSPPRANADPPSPPPSKPSFKAQRIAPNAPKVDAERADPPSFPRSEPSSFKAQEICTVRTSATADDPPSASMSWRRRCSSSMEGEASLPRGMSSGCLEQPGQGESPLVSPRALNEYISRSHFRKLSVVGNAELPTAGDDPKEAPACDPDDPAGLTATVHIKRTDMPDSALQHAIRISFEAVQKRGWDNEIAARIKKKMDKIPLVDGAPGQWHAIVGGNFGSYVTHESGSFAHFLLMRFPNPREEQHGLTGRKPIAILIFRT